MTYAGRDEMGEIIRKVRDGNLHLLSPNGKSYLERLKTATQKGRIDKDEAHRAIIAGEKWWPEVVRTHVESGLGDTECPRPPRGRTYTAEMNSLKEGGFISREDAQKAIVEGYKNSGKW